MVCSSIVSVASTTIKNFLEAVRHGADQLSDFMQLNLLPFLFHDTEQPFKGSKGSSVNTFLEHFPKAFDDVEVKASSQAMDLES